MEWNEITISKIESFIDVPIEKGDFRRVDRRFSGLAFAPCGKVVYYHGGKEYISDSTHVLYLPANEKYTLECFEGDICPILNFVCDFDRSEFLSFTVPDTSVFVEKYDKMKEKHYGADEDRHHFCLRELYDILAFLGRVSLPDEKGEYSRDAIRIMRKNLAKNELSNDSIAAMLNISTVYFRKVFYEEVGMPPMSYLRKLRMERAMELLKIPKKSVGEVAAEVGYSGIYPFSRVFKRETGMTPSDYAAKYKNAY
ncbi:MAG: helix-turn-helix transcriptional regulator [Clostridia bacterium]|nr:helix-turn-helix transcriptional regulator [Clostridia bacterium]